MSNLRSDPLLTVTLVVTRAMTILLLFAAAAIVVAAAFIAFDMIGGSTELRSENPDVDFAAFQTQLWSLLPLALIGIGFAAAFFHMLAKIVKSVGEGDPFLAINARRLRYMAWLALAFQLIAIPVGLIEALLNSITGDPGGFDPSIAGFVLALVLLVLARVFERGAEMHDDLEGTV